MTNKVKNVPSEESMLLMDDVDKVKGDTSARAKKRCVTGEEVKSTSVVGERAVEIHGLLSKITLFLKEVRSEFDKINWPTRKKTVSMATAVLAISFFFAVYLGITDIVLSKLVGFLIRG